MAILISLPKGNNPCLDCTRRRLGCHSKCEDYKIFKEKIAELRKNQRNQTRSGSERSAELYSNYSANRKSKKAILKLFERTNKTSR